MDLEVDGTLGGVATHGLGPTSGHPQGLEPLRRRELRPAALRAGVAEAREDLGGVIRAAAGPNQPASVRATSDSRSRRSRFGSFCPRPELGMQSGSRGTGIR